MRLRERLQRLTRPERWAIYLWVAAGTWTVLAFAMPGLTMLVTLF